MRLSAFALAATAASALYAGSASAFIISTTATGGSEGSPSQPTYQTSIAKPINAADDPGTDSFTIKWKVPAGTGGARGGASPFPSAFACHEKGFALKTAILPRGWIDRVHRVQSAATNQRVGYCLDLTDLFISKAAAGRDKDREFCMAMLSHRYVRPEVVLDLVSAMPLDDAAQRRLKAAIRRWAKAVETLGDDVPRA